MVNTQEIERARARLKDVEPHFILSQGEYTKLPQKSFMDEQAVEDYNLFRANELAFRTKQKMDTTRDLIDLEEHGRKQALKMQATLRASANYLKKQQDGGKKVRAGANSRPQKVNWKDHAIKNDLIARAKRDFDIALLEDRVTLMKKNEKITQNLPFIDSKSWHVEQQRQLNEYY